MLGPSPPSIEPAYADLLRVRGFGRVVLGTLLMGISYVYQRDWLKLSRAAQAQEPTNPA